MPRFFGLIALLSLLLGNAIAQPQRPEKIPSGPETDAGRTALDAQKLFANGSIQMKRGLFLDAMKSFEACLKLDPDAVPPRRMLAVVYLTVARTDEALAMAKQVTEKLPDDYDGWRVYAEQLWDLGRKKDAILALNKSLESPTAAKYPVEQYKLAALLANWATQAEDYATAATARRKFLDVLIANRDRFLTSEFLSDDDERAERAAAWEGLGIAQLKLNRIDDAAGAFNQARRVFDGRDDLKAKLWLARLNLHEARICHARNDDANALRHLRQYLADVKPGNLEPFRLLAEVLPKSGEPNPTAVFAELAGKDPNNLSLQLLVAEQYTRHGQSQLAERIYHSLAEKHPKPEVYRALFLHFERGGRYNSILNKLDEHGAVIDLEQNEDKLKVAREHMRAMLAVLVKHPSIVLKLLPLAHREQIDQLFRMNNKYHTFERMAGLAVRTDRLEEAEELLREALRSLRSNAFRASVDHALIRVLLARKKFDDVRQLCRDRMQNVEDNRFLYHLYLDGALAYLGETDEGLRVNEQTIELAFSEQNKYTARSHRVELLHQGGRTAEALRECENMLADFPGLQFARDTRFRIATLLSHERKHAESEKILRQLLENDPNDARACNFLGYELADQSRKLDEAEKLIRRALELDKRARKAGDDDGEVVEDEENPAYLDSLAWVRFRRGHLTEAKTLLEKATTLSGGRDEPTLWDHLGDILYRLNESTKAREAWAKARDLYRHEPIAAKDGRLAEVMRKLDLLK